MKKTFSGYFFDYMIIFLLAILGFATLYPFIYVLSLSLSTPAESMKMGLHFFPKNPTLLAYKEIIGRVEIRNAYTITVLRTVIGTAITLILTTMVAYPLARRQFPHRKILMFLFIFSMMFGGGLVASYLLIKSLGLIDTLWVYVIPGSIGAWNVIIMRNFFQAIPEELIESATIDGANEWTILSSVIIPLSMPILAVVGLWSAVGQWNAWFDSMIYTNKSSLRVLQLFLRQIVITETSSFLGDVQNQSERTMKMNPESLKAATVMIISMPIVIVYPFIQRFFVKGIMLGSVKG